MSAEQAIENGERQNLTTENKIKTTQNYFVHAERVSYRLQQQVIKFVNILSLSEST